MNNKLKELKEKISNAFHDVKYPGDDKIAIKTWYLDDERLDGYVGLKREHVTVGFINDGHRDCTSFMTDEAFHYYLPAFLIICAEAGDTTDIFAEYIIQKLMPPLESDHTRLLTAIRKEAVTSEEVNVYSGKLEIEKNKFYLFIK